MTTPNTSTPPAKKPTYVASSGNLLDTPPLSARLSRTFDDFYNFLGLYFVSLLSLDPFTAAQNSQFNLRHSGGVNSYQNRPRWNGGVNRTGGTVGGGGSGGGGGGGLPRRDAGQQPPRRPIGTVDDVRGPECGSCG